VLKQLRLGSSLIKEADGRYWVRMVGAMTKNGKPCVFALPKQLTEPFDYYFSTIRPELLRQHGGEDAHDHVFFKKNGSAPRKDFSELTALATTQLIGRAVNPHAFRSAVITAFYEETGASDTQMGVLAQLMSHDAAVARNVYYRPKMAKAAVDTSDRMLAVLDLSDRNPNHSSLEE
jgi:site-specific recombinase XerD